MKKARKFKIIQNGTFKQGTKNEQWSVPWGQSETNQLEISLKSHAFQKFTDPYWLVSTERYGTQLFPFPLSEVVNGTKIANRTVPLFWYPSAGVPSTAKGTFTFMHLADAFIQSDSKAIHLYCQYMCSLGIEPTTFALLTQCSNHWATGTKGWSWTHCRSWLVEGDKASPSLVPLCCPC